ncbi:MAG: nrdJ, partial [Modestobacter sp.]|nr:nrdJ [Modestobacter sp.]
FSIGISIALQHGVPLETYNQKLTNMRFEPAGMTDDPDIPNAQSVMDYIFRRLALDHLPVENRNNLGIFTAQERAAQVAGSYGTGSSTSTVEEEDVDLEQLRGSAPIETAQVEEKVTPVGPKSVKEAHSSAELLELVTGTATDAPLCMTCGTKMRPAGSCYVCEGCGSTSGCS